jgi:hypothetical protein
MSSNYGNDTFLAAPGEGIETTSASGGYATISGTSAAAAGVAGAAALMIAAAPGASNGVIVGRLARNADAAGTSDQTGNGRLNLARAIADTDTTSIEPAGAPPVGDGGPYVGPYVVAARNFDLTFAGTGGGSVTIHLNSGQGTVLVPSTCGGSGVATSSDQTVTGTCTNINFSSNTATGTLTANPNATSVFANWSAATNMNTAGTGCQPATTTTANPCAFSFAGANPTVTATFTAANPVPTTSSISPTSRFAGDGAFTLTVNGTNFVSGSVVRWNGSDRTTTFLSSTQLTAAISATDMTTAGSKTITVFNPAPGGGTSSSQTFTVNANPVPTTTSIAPSTVFVGNGGFALTVNGTNFVANSVVRVNGSDRTTTFISSTQLSATIPASDVASTGTRTITVFNPTPGGATSNSQTLSITPCTNKICIDGNMADWNALATTPSYADNPSDQGGGSTDITGIQLTAGDGNLYVR